MEGKWVCKMMGEILRVKVEGCGKEGKGIIWGRDVEKFV